MKHLLIITCLFCTLFMVSSCNGTKRATSNSGKVTKGNSKKGGVQFVNSKTLTAVLEEAEKENKLVFLDFYTSWCTPCKMMDEDVFPDKTTV